MTSDRLVVGAIIVDSLRTPTKVLAARRTGPPALAGMWEFPGGKVEDGEMPEAALIREIREELGVAVSVGAELSPDVGTTWPASAGYVMRLFFATVIGGQPTPGEAHSETRWLTSETLESIEWLPSDRNALDSILLR